MSKNTIPDNIIYVEPNDIDLEYEDLSIFLKLSIYVPSRTYLKDNGGGKDYIVTWDGKGLMQSIGQASKGTGYLSTYYTDISWKEKINGGVEEAFGIKSVDISYRTWFYPEVTINFVDIRASALFKTAEGNVDNEDVTNIILQSFFSFPYPNFEMTVKGFFGKAVTYHLVAQSFKASFNSSAGNFEAVGSFIGQVYGSLADIPMKFLFVSPYLKNAKLGTFPGTETEIPTFSGLVKIMNDSMLAATEYAQKENEKNKTTEEKIAELDTKITLCEQLIQYMGNCQKDNVGHGIVGDNLSVIIVKMTNDSINTIIKGVSDDKDKYRSIYGGGISSDAEEGLPGFSELFGKAPEQPNVSQTNVTEIINTIISSEDMRKELLYESHNTDPKPDGLVEPYSYRTGFLHNYSDKSEAFRSYYFKDGVNASDVLALVNSTDKGFDDNKTIFYSVLKFGSTTVQSYTDEKDKLTKELEKKKEDITEGAQTEFNKRVGFKPTIRNMFYIVFAHLSLFVKQYGNVIDTIMNSTDRTFSDDLVKDTDYIAGKDTRIGPYPMVYSSKEPKDIIYPGYRGEFENLYELDYVQAIFDAVKKEYSEYLNEFAAGKAALLNAQVSGKDIAYLPTLATDLLHLATNPYEKVFTGNPEAKKNALNTIFGIRLATYLSAGDQYFIGWDSSEIKTWLKIEAFNAYLATSKSDKKSFEEVIGDDKLKYSDNWASDVTKSDTTSARITNKQIFRAVNKLSGDSAEFVTELSSIPFNYSGDLYTAIVDSSTVLGEFSTCSKSTGGANSSYKIFQPEEVETMFNDIVHTAQKSLDVIGVDGANYIASVSRYFFNSDSVNAGGTGIKIESSAYNIYYALIKYASLMNTEVGEKMTNIIGVTFNEKDLSREKDIYYALEKQTTKTIFSMDYLYDRFVKQKSGGLVTIINQYWLYDAFLTYYYIKHKDKCPDKDRLTEYLKRPNVSYLMGKGEAYFYFYRFVCSLCYGIKKPDGNMSQLTMFELPLMYNISNVRLCRVKYIELIAEYFFYHIYYKDNKSNMENQELWNLYVRGALWCNDADMDAIMKKLTDDYILNNWWPKFKEFCEKKDITKDMLKHPYVRARSGGAARIDEDAISIREELQRAFFSEYNDALKLNADVFVYSPFYHVCFDNPEYGSKTGVYPDEGSLFSSDYPDIDIICSGATCGKLGRCCVVHTDSSFKKVLGNDIVPTKGDIVRMFFENLEEYYNGTNDSDSNGGGLLNADPEDIIATKAQKLAIYLTLKNLYDRWQLNNGTLKDFAGDNEDFSNFKFYDAFRRDIGDKIIVGIPNFFNLCSMVNDANGAESEGMSVYAFLSELCKQNDCVFVSLPIDIYGGVKSHEDYMKLFEPVPYANIAQNTSKCPSFLCIYSSKPSEHIDLGNYDDGYDDDGADFLKPDGVEKSDDENDDTNEKLPLFGITYGYEKQHLFKTVDISMDNPKNTEYSLKSTMFISQQGAERSVSTAGFVGNDVYNAYANSMYTCNVEMMGDMCIMPTMYFQLNNVPMFRGTYMITSVRHTIHGGNINTSFSGVRMNRYCFEPIKEDVDLSQIMDTSKVYAFNGSAGDIEKGASAAYDKEHTFNEIYATINGTGGGSSSSSSYSTNSNYNPGGDRGTIEAKVGILAGCKTLKEKLEKLIANSGIPKTVDDFVVRTLSTARYINANRQYADDISNITYYGEKACSAGIPYVLKGLGKELQDIFNELEAYDKEKNGKKTFVIKISSALRINPSAGGHSRHEMGCAVDINGVTGGDGGAGNPYYNNSFYNEVADKQSWDSFEEGKHINNNASAYRRIEKKKDGTTKRWSTAVYSKAKSIWGKDHPLISIFANHGFGWGGWYGDTMHFSIDSH